MLKEKLSEDLKKAMKSGDQTKAGVFRMLLSAIHNKEIEARAKSGSDKLADDQIAAILGTEAKKRKEAIEIYKKGGRPELASKEEAELKIIQNYLPKQFTSEEISKFVEALIKKENFKDFGSAMKAVMKELKGKADAKTVGEILNRFLKS
ncbi:MAG TPA: GatB/YqeY domain-containing protein [Candidatus Paceibacterota bacterium]